ncbi:MAG: hypothetical protein IJB65_04405 [Clostridia bacterium]|nr:hypothetical protein [Clostridia bacterium]
MQEEKKQTVKYVFLHTVVMQIIFWVVFVSVGCWAYWFSKYNSSIMALAGMPGFLAMLFANICISVFTTNYGLNISSKKRKDFNGENKAEPIYRYDYSYGPKNPLTGQKPVYVKKREVKSGGAVILFGLKAVSLGFTGVFKFFVERNRVIHDDERQALWEDCRQHLYDKIAEDGKEKFFKTPKKVATVLLACWALALPTIIYLSSAYSDNNVSLVITEKLEYTNDGTYVEAVYKASLTNKGSGKISMVEGVMRFVDKNGNLLGETEMFFDPRSESFGKNDSEQFNVTYIAYASDENSVKLCKSDLNEITILFDVTSIKYSGATPEQYFPKEKFKTVNKMLVNTGKK